MLKQSLHELLRQLGVGPLPAWADALIAISNVLLVLLLRPHGLFGRREIERL